MTADMFRLPLEDQSVDWIVASNVLYFCDDVAALVEECRRVSRPGAMLVIYITAQSTLRKWRFASAATHRHFSGPTLVSELQQADVGEIVRTMVEQLELTDGRSVDLDVGSVSMPVDASTLFSIIVTAPGARLGAA